MYNNIKILAVDDNQEDVQLLKDCYKTYKDITDTVLEGLWMVDENGHTTYVNKQLIDMLGYTQDELVNKQFFNFIDSKFQDKAKEFFERRKQGLKDRYDSCFIKKDGSILWVIISATPIFDDKGKFVGAIGLFTDITEHKIIRDKLIENEEHYRTIVEFSNDMIWILDTDGKFTFINKRSEKIGGYSLEELKGKSFCPLIVKEDTQRVIDTFHRVLNGQYQEYDVTFINKYNKKVMLSVNTAPIYSKGKIVGTVSFGRDITQQKRIEQKAMKITEELIHSSNELEQFAYIASHDLQEPLRSISSFTELLAHRYKDRLDPEADEFINYIINGTKRMQQMINDLLTLSRINTKGKEFVSTNIKDVINKVLENLHSLIDRNQAVITIDNMPIASVDEIQFIQLFQNLIDNAIKFRKKDTVPQIHISARKEENEWIFSVKDNGIGIDPNSFRKLFIIFQRLHSREEYPGTGIGLAICKKIIGRHDGRIWIESRPGEGSTFYFSIPIKRGENNNNGK